MIQFNLLPDVKLEYVKKQRSKRLVMMGSFAVTGICVLIMVLLFMIVNVFQKQHISNLDEDIDQSIADLERIPDLDKVLTIQNQLDSLKGLHETKPAVQRLYTYLIQLTPTDAKISQVTVNFDEQKMTLEGSATSLQVINKFVDTIKFTKYQYGDIDEKAFSEVVLSSYGISQDTTANNRTTYTIDFTYNPDIFDNTLEVVLSVPAGISTRSITEKPQDLFEAKPAETTQQNGAQ